MKRPDNTPYFSDPYFDNGQWYFDGGILTFNFGQAALNLFGGRQYGRMSTDGTELNPMFAGNSMHIFEPGGISGNNPSRPRGIGIGEIAIDQHIGATLNVPIGKGALNVNYLIFDSNQIVTLNNGAPADRVNVFGGDIAIPVGEAMKIFGGYSQSNVMLGDTNVINEDNKAWWAGFDWHNNQFGAQVGYRSIDPNFAAPGAWGRIGIWWNPTDIQGFWAKANVNLGENVGIMGSFERYQGRDIIVFGGAGLTSDDTVTSFKIDLNYNSGPNMMFWLGYEHVEWDVANRAAPGDGSSFTGGKPEENWYNIGMRYRMTDNAWWSLKWQISDYDSKGVAGFNPFSFSGSPIAKGGFITSQFGIKF
jgi:hypothetical protein